VPGVAFSVTVGCGYATVTSTEVVDVPPGPVQTSAKVVVAVSAAEVSVPDGGRLPVHPFDAVQAVASVLVHERVVVPFGATLVGSAFNTAVGVLGGATATFTDAVASPPDPEHFNVNVAAAVSAGVVSAPDAARLPVQAPDAVQEAAFVLLHLSCSVPP